MRKYENDLSALYFTLDAYTKKANEAKLPHEVAGYTEEVEYTQEQINKRIKQLDSGINTTKKIPDEQLAEYHILNLSECGREWIEYQIPEGYDTTENYMEWKEANEYIAYLKDLNRDPSFMVSILGYYIHDEDYIQVVYKVKAIN